MNIGLNFGWTFLGFAQTHFFGRYALGEGSMAITGSLRKGLYRVFASFVLAVVLMWPIEAMSAPKPGPLDAQASLQLLHSGADIFLLDVRTEAEYARGHIPNAVLIPVDQLETRLAEIPADRPLVIICRTGRRAAWAFEQLHRLRPQQSMWYIQAVPKYGADGSWTIED